MILPCTLLLLNIFLGILIGSTRNTWIWTWCEELTHWKRPWCWERLKAGEGDDRGWDDCMALPTRWTWVWVSSGSWWWTGSPGVLQSMGSQRVGQDSATELNWTELNSSYPSMKKVKVKSLSRARLFATPWTVACTKLLRPWDFPGKSTGVGCHFLLQGIFPTQRSNPGLPHCRQMLYRLSHRESQTYFPHPSGQGALLYPTTFFPNFTPPDHWFCHFPTHFQQITFGLFSRINRS